MPAMTDPYVALVSFQEALKKGLVSPQPCTSRRNLYVVADSPAPGVQRLTYAVIEGATAQAIAIFVVGDLVDGKPCLDLGYAVAEKYRKQGLGQAIVEDSIPEPRKGLDRYLREPGLYVQAVVGIDNEASRKIAERTLSATPDEITDYESGLPALHYRKYVS